MRSFHCMDMVICSVCVCVSTPLLHTRVTQLSVQLLPSGKVSSCSSDHYQGEWLLEWPYILHTQQLIKGRRDDCRLGCARFSFFSFSVWLKGNFKAEGGTSSRLRCRVNLRLVYAECEQRQRRDQLHHPPLISVMQVSLMLDLQNTNSKKKTQPPSSVHKRCWSIISSIIRGLNHRLCHDRYDYAQKHRLRSDLRCKDVFGVNYASLSLQGSTWECAPFLCSSENTLLHTENSRHCGWRAHMH